MEAYEAYGFICEDADAWGEPIPDWNLLTDEQQDQLNKAWSRLLDDALNEFGYLVDEILPPADEE